MRAPLAAAACALLAAGAGAAAAQGAGGGQPDGALALLRAGDYGAAIAAYDEALEADPDSRWALAMKGVALSNSGRHAESLRHFHRAHQADASDPLALTGLGVGFGYLGEYREAERYLRMAAAADPGYAPARNYLDTVGRALERYPYTPTEKPAALGGGPASLPGWLRQPAGWWAAGLTGDAEFAGALQFLVAEGAAAVPGAAAGGAPGIPAPAWAREAAGRWAAGGPDGGFAGAVRHLTGAAGAGAEYERGAFSLYVARIERDAGLERRYVEPPNPSVEVIKKFLRDHERWNFEGEASRPPGGFPDPEASVSGGRAELLHRVFVNDQPTGLPLDHVGTLRDSLAYWEGRALEAGGRDASARFEITDDRREASVWVTWVVRDLGEGVLGHAHLGKGVVEVALGDHSCDGSFQLYDVGTVRRIMTHELGHSIGLRHSADPAGVMYPSLRPGYAYCLLG